jgi:hypothetical protein
MLVANVHAHAENGTRETALKDVPIPIPASAAIAAGWEDAVVIIEYHYAPVTPVANASVFAENGTKGTAPENVSTLVPMSVITSAAQEVAGAIIVTRRDVHAMRVASANANAENGIRKNAPEDVPIQTPATAATPATQGDAIAITEDRTYS